MCRRLLGIVIGAAIGLGACVPRPGFAQDAPQISFATVQIVAWGAAWLKTYDDNGNYVEEIAAKALPLLPVAVQRIDLQNRRVAIEILTRERQTVRRYLDITALSLNPPIALGRPPPDRATGGSTCPSGNCNAPLGITSKLERPPALPGTLPAEPRMAAIARLPDAANQPAAERSPNRVLESYSKWIAERRDHASNSKQQIAAASRSEARQELALTTLLPRNQQPVAGFAPGTPVASGPANPSAAQIIASLQPSVEPAGPTRGVRLAAAEPLDEKQDPACNSAGSMAALTLAGFESGSSLLSAAQKERLARVAPTLKAQADAGRWIFVRGQADATGNIQANDILSIRRAQSTARLLESFGIPQGRVAFAGSGSAQVPLVVPVAADDACKRRVEIYVLESGAAATAAPARAAQERAARKPDTR